MLVNSSNSASSAVTGAIQQASQATGTSFNYLLATAQVESGLNPQAGASTSSARGLFQFIETTWLATIKQAGTPPVGNELSTEAETAEHCPSDTVVWGNLTSKIYHFKTSRFYENTKNSEYMCEGDAVAAGMRPAKKERHPRTN
jgi:Transglycosylase SLT domain